MYVVRVESNVLEPEPSKHKRLVLTYLVKKFEIFLISAKSIKFVKPFWPGHIPFAIFLSSFYNVVDKIFLF